MYIQHCLKGIAGEGNGHAGMSWDEARARLSDRHGITSNWWRGKGTITAPEKADILTEDNLDRHLHDYENYGAETPFISLTAGAVSRDFLARRNHDYSALDTALMFATNNWQQPGAIFHCWVPVALNPSVEVEFVAEAVRDLLTYRRWSDYQLEGELTAKVHIPASQISHVDWWDGATSMMRPADTFPNTRYVPPDGVLNLRNWF